MAPTKSDDKAFTLLFVDFLSFFFVFWWVVIDKVAFRGWESSSCTPVGPALGSEG
jgi:hypothetical protein